MVGPEIMQWLNQETHTLLSFLIQITIKASAVLILAWSSTRLLPRASAATRHFVWTLAVVSCLSLPLLNFTLPGWRIDIPRPETKVGQQNQHPLPWSLSDDRKTDLQAIEQSLAKSARPENRQAETEVAMARNDKHQKTFQWPAFLLFLWITGVGVVFTKHLVGRIRIATMARHAKVIDDPYSRSEVSTLKTELGIQRPVRVLKCDRSTMPMTWGIFRPAILLPAESAHWTPARRRLVLLHELAHIKRMDCLTQLLAQLMEALYWFNPIFWLSNSEMRREREHACDDYVLSQGSRASEYAELLLDFARSMQSVRLTSLATVAMARPSQLEGRMLAILNPHLRRNVLTHFSIILGCLTVIGLVLPLAAMQPVWETTVEPSQAVPVPENPVTKTLVDSRTGTTPTETENVAERPGFSENPHEPRTKKETEVELTTESTATMTSKPLPQASAIQDENDFVVNALIEVLQDSSLEVRLQAVETLGKLENRAAVAALSRALQDADWRMRVYAAEALSEIEDPAAVEDLTYALNDDIPQVRESVIEALAEIGDRRAVPALMKSLQDSEWQIRQQAAEALGELEDSRAVAALKNALKDDHREVKIAAIEALGEIQASDAVSSLADALKDKDWIIRKHAAWALGEIEHPAAVDPLISVVNDETDEVRKTAIWALGEIEDPAAVGPLVDLLKDENWQLRKVAAWALGEIGDRRAIEPLTILLKDPNQDVRKEAVNALGEMKWHD